MASVKFRFNPTAKLSESDIEFLKGKASEFNLELKTDKDIKAFQHKIGYVVFSKVTEDSASESEGIPRIDLTASAMIRDLHNLFLSGKSNKKTNYREQFKSEIILKSLLKRNIKGK